MERKRRDLLTSLLRSVSRSFYLTLRILPQEIRPQVSLAYLLARASDTIADTKVVAKKERVGILRRMQSFFSNPPVAADFIRDLEVFRDRSRLETAPTTAGEARLMGGVGDCLRLLATFPQADRQRIGDLLQTIITGQIYDLEQFPGESGIDLAALASGEELDRYTYMVAGCVGEFWTRMCKAHLKELEGWDDASMEAMGIRFGKGLQLVNVLRDIPKDLRIGRCYLPVKEPKLLLDPADDELIRAEYTKWLDCAVDHLEAGWQYTMEIPSSLWRLRLACVWPIWIGLKTIARLREANPLDPSRRVKVSRLEVYGVMLESFLLRRNNAALNGKARRLFTAARGK